MRSMVPFFTLLRREVMRFVNVPSQTIASPVITVLLFTVVFGAFLGPRIGDVNGVPYILFFIPGLAMMNAITSSFSNSSFSVYFMRLQGFVDDLLITPLSHFELVLAFTLAAVTRGVVVTVIIYAIAMLFTNVVILHPLLLIYFVFFSTAIFGLLGIMMGLWSEAFEHVNILPTFVIAPLSLVGGVFHSVEMLPADLQFLSFANPFFYMVNGFRFATTGLMEADILLSAVAVFVITAVLFAATYVLFMRGYKLRT